MENMTLEQIREEALRGRSEAIEELFRRANAGDYRRLQQEITTMRCVIAFGRMLEREILCIAPGGGCSTQARRCIGKLLS
jgi:hypothetical protein